MSRFRASLDHNLRRLLEFGGRTSPLLFWPYVAAFLVLFGVGTFAVIVPQMLLMFQRMQALAAAHPEQATVRRDGGSYPISIQGNHPELAPDFTLILNVISVLIVFAVLMLSAAVARRLHDRGRSGAWGLLPIPFLALSLFEMHAVFGSLNGGEPDLGAFFAVFFSNIAYLGALACLVVLLIGRGTQGNNRFGSEATA